MAKRPFINRLNELSPKEWLKFQKSWFIHNPPPRQKGVLRHPAKFPETLAAEFIQFFTKPGQVVFDPMLGTGSTLVAALRLGRRGYGIELNPEYAEIARQVIESERRTLSEEPRQPGGFVPPVRHPAGTTPAGQPGNLLLPEPNNSRMTPAGQPGNLLLPEPNNSRMTPAGQPGGFVPPEPNNSRMTPAEHLESVVITGDAAKMSEYFTKFNFPLIDYVLTSPPYWNMLHAQGAFTQKKRRASGQLDVTYSNYPNDLGNIEDYDEFLESLVMILHSIKPQLRLNAYLTIIVKNVKKGGKIYPLAWDLAKKLSEIYTLKDEKIWLQDNQRLAPYGLGNAWVSNTFHHYCLQFRNVDQL
jgi:DNA modification methylase